MCYRQPKASLLATVINFPVTGIKLKHLVRVFTGAARKSTLQLIA